MPEAREKQAKTHDVSEDGTAAREARAAALWATLQAVRAERPLIHNITNYVAMETVANALLALGASPVMAHAPEEVEEIASVAGALAINIGTLDERWVDSMARAARAAVEAGRPWVLDPVGAGATTYRTETAQRLARLQPEVIRANGSEVMSIEAREGRGRGVDSGVDSVDALDAAHALAQRSGAIVAVTGAVDYVTNGREVAAVANGHEMLGGVTAMGCTVSAIVGACLAVENDALAATVDGLTLFGIAGEVAAERSSGPGSFRVALIDALAALDEATILQRIHID